MRRVAAESVPKLLNCDQKQHRMNIANEMLDFVRDDPNLLQRVITGDEAWVYGYDVETKAQSSQWKLPHEPKRKKRAKGVVHHEFLPQGRTVNKEYYLQVMRNLREAIRQKRPDLWKNKNRLLHHDNALAHTSLLVRDFLAKNNTLMMPQPPYSPELAPCDFFLFPKLMRPMKGRRYATLDEIKTASKEELKKIFFLNDFLKCFEDWKNRWHKSRFPRLSSSPDWEYPSPGTQIRLQADYYLGFFSDRTSWTARPPPPSLESVNQHFFKKTSEENFENQKHAKSPAGIKHANSAAAPDVTAPITAAATSAEPTSKNWCDSVEMEMGDEQNNGFTLVVRNKKRRRGSSSSEHAARQPSKPRVQHNTQQRKQLTGPRAMPPQQFKATRANIADAKARQTSSTQDNYIFVEVCPDISSYKYLQAIDKLVGGPRNITQFNKMNGHYIVGLASKDLASRLLGSDLDIEGTLLKIFPYRKRAERIVVANLPGFVEESAVVEALHPYGKVTSIAPILIKMGEYAFTDGRREAFILLHKDIKLENLPTRLDIVS
ncbi:hypothetical protein LAZ67_6003158 [Cordylochernes scorpioides]|uniref:Mariner Mos1 transposase n=1 Tax=Cordylochernes scorpioides TaxID=51811 RepID=A0ABY6KLB8_9ARAC|nr:hypothetical protein LAZ67_6003158 [Cordylochernes scorpioides]